MLVQIAQLFLSLTILVTLHEFGHFWFAKLFKCKVEKFYLFFDFLFPFANVANFALFKKKIGDTEYGIGWFPFGGYVSIVGMVDEQMDKDIVDKEPEPHELRAKPAWQRLLVMMGGILVNLILGIFIFWMVVFVWGKNSLPLQNLKHGLSVDSTAYNIGLRNGDFITHVGEIPVTDVSKIPINLIMNGGSSLSGIHADGKKFSIPVTNNDKGLILKRIKKSYFVEPRVKMQIIDSVEPTGYAASAKIQPNDKIIAVNNKKIIFYDEFRTELSMYKKEIVAIKLLRGKDTITTKCNVNDEGKILIKLKEIDDVKLVHKDYTFFQSLKEGWNDAVEKIIMQAKQFVVIFTVKDAYKSVGGFATMTKAMSTTWDWHHFWFFTGLLSLGLAFMNFLPIPMLDGGYIMFILWEMVTGKKVSDKVIYYANQVGLFIVLGLMIFANTDWLRD